MFQRVHPNEIERIQNFMLTYYSEQLVEAGLFTDVNVAREIAERTEWVDERNDKNKEIFYYDLISEDSAFKYGFLVYWTEKELAYIDTVYLEKAYRGQGLGTEIFKELESSLKEKNIERIKLYVFAHNLPAFGLYRKMGYVIEETYYQDDRLIGHHMIKNL